MKTQLYLLSTLLLSSSVIAEQVKNEENVNHIYLGAKAGYSYINNSCYDHYSDCDNDNFGYGIFAGYQFKDWLSAELDATDYRNYDALYDTRIVKADVQGYGLSLKASHPLWDNTQGYVRVGGAYLDLNRSASFELDDNSGFSAIGAVGVEYQLSTRWALRAEYQYLADVSGSEGHFTSLGLSYHFGKEIKPKTIMPVVVEAPKPIEESPEVIEPEPKTTVFEISGADSAFDGAANFELNSSKLSMKAKSTLDEAVKVYNKSPDSYLWVTGFTDGTGTSEYNLWLSIRRALAVKEYLANKGVTRVTSRGKGKFIPSSTEANPAHRKIVIELTQENQSPASWSKKQ
ncbi:outer membrane beta-barrel protein [Shewanella sp. A25]|nr:outer membrane beta-barrel protein [Shewanella shenzhenensis]